MHHRHEFQTSSWSEVLQTFDGLKGLFNNWTRILFWEPVLAATCEIVAWSNSEAAIKRGRGTHDLDVCGVMWGDTLLWSWSTRNQMAKAGWGWILQRIQEDVSLWIAGWLNGMIDLMSNGKRPTSRKRRVNWESADSELYFSNRHGKINYRTGEGWGGAQSLRGLPDELFILEMAGQRLRVRKPAIFAWSTLFMVDQWWDHRKYMVYYEFYCGTT
jgi:hypothetical protein